MDRPLLSLCMIARDESELIPDCLESVAPFVDETVVVDTGSSDRTPTVADRAGAIVVRHAWNDDFSQARNAGLERTTGRFVLVVDADERVDGGISPAELRQTLLAASAEAFRVEILDRFDGGVERRSSRIRLFRNCPEHRFEGLIDERIESSIARRVGCDKLDAPSSGLVLVHDGYRHERRTRRRAEFIALLKRRLRDDSSDATIRFLLIRELVVTRRGRALPGSHLPEALRMCRDLDPWRAKLDPGHAQELVRLRAAAMLENGQGEAALRLLVTRSNGHPSLKLLRAEAELALAAEDVEYAGHALQRFRECFDLEDFGVAGSRDLPPTAPGVRARAAECLLRLGRRDEARTLVNQATSAPSAGPAPWIARAHLALDESDAHAAAEAYAEAVRVDPYDPRATAGLGETRLAAGAASAAIEPLSDALRLAPGWERAEEVLAAALLIEGKRDELQAAFRHHGGAPGSVGEAVRMLETAAQGTRPVIGNVDSATDRSVRRILLRAAAAGSEDVVERLKRGLSAPDSAIA